MDIFDYLIMGVFENDDYCNESVCRVDDGNFEKDLLLEDDFLDEDLMKV